MLPGAAGSCLPLPASFSHSLSPSLPFFLSLCIHLSLSVFCLAICALFSSLPPHSICSLRLSGLYLSISVWMRALGQRWVGVSVFLILFMPLSHPYFYTRSQRLSLSVCVCVYVFLCLYVVFCLYLPLGVSFSFFIFFCFSLRCVHLLHFSFSPAGCVSLSLVSSVLASSFQVSLSLSVSFSPPCHRGTQRTMFTQRLMGGKELTLQKGASKPGEQPVWKLIMCFHSD